MWFRMYINLVRDALYVNLHDLPLYTCTIKYAVLNNSEYITCKHWHKTMWGLFFIFYPENIECLWQVTSSSVGFVHNVIVCPHVSLKWPYMGYICGVTICCNTVFYACYIYFIGRFFLHLPSLCSDIMFAEGSITTLKFVRT